MSPDKQYCKGCQHNRTLDNFTEGFATCNRCRAKQLRRYHNNPEYYKQKKKEYRENNPEKIKEAQHEYSLKSHFCSVCNDLMQLKNKAKH